MQLNEIIHHAKSILAIPVGIYQAIRQAIWDWNNIAFHRSDNTTKGEQGELAILYARLLQYERQGIQTRAALPQRVVQRVFSLLPDQPTPPLATASIRLISEIIANEGLFSIPKIDLNRKLTTSQVWELTSTLKQLLAPFEKPEAEARIEQTLETLLKNLLPELRVELPYDEGETPLYVPFHVMLSKPAQKVEAVLAVIFDPSSESPFPRLGRQLECNALIASGIDPDEDVNSHKQPVLPTQVKNKQAAEIIQQYLAGTPLVDFLQTPLPFSIPFKARFEHTHIIGGSGHGKTQLLQHMILDDLKKLTEGKGSIVVIDSQGDMIRTITHLAEFSPSHPQSLADRLVLIDPNDIEHPPCLNLFDFGLDRLGTHSPVEREKLINGAIALYEYLFGALLGAELTQRQGVIFRFLARLMMTIPGATIHTLMDLVENPEATRPHFSKLDPVSKRFFDTQFFSKSFDATRQQILTRLWGVLSNSVLERMFGNEHNKLDLYEAMNKGNIILINTAKDLLKQEGCEILGRFFIALIAQAAQERATISEDRRRSTFVYIDEAHDYFDYSLENLLNTARKYRVGLVLSHQNLGQFETSLRATVMASTAIKMVGGLSAKDAEVISKDMRCEPEYLLSMRKGADYSQFACYVKNHTERPLPLTVPLGEMERRPRMNDDEYLRLIEANRAGFSAGTRGLEMKSEPEVKPKPLDVQISTLDLPEEF
jgi:hypothetical protein